MGRYVAAITREIEGGEVEAFLKITGTYAEIKCSTC